MDEFAAPHTDEVMEPGARQTRWTIVAVQAAALVILQGALSWAVGGIGTAAGLDPNYAFALQAPAMGLGAVIWGKSFHRRFGHDPPARPLAIKIAFLGVAVLSIGPYLGLATTAGELALMFAFGLGGWLVVTWMGIMLGVAIAGEPQGPRKPVADGAVGGQLDPLGDFLGGVPRRSAPRMPDPYEQVDDEHTIRLDD